MPSLSVRHRGHLRASRMAPDVPLMAIRPADKSLASHLQALDALSYRLEALNSRTRWPARIPLNGKASVKGSIVHTNELKVDVGGGYWVEMTAKEAQEYVQRRKTGKSTGPDRAKLTISPSSTTRWVETELVQGGL